MKKLVGALPIFAALVPTAFAQSGTKISFNAGEEPEAKTWTQPASFNYTDNAESEDNWAIDMAGKIEGRLRKGSSHTKFARVLVQRNTLTAKEVENYVAEIGTKLDFSTESWFLPTKFSLAFADKTVFPDSKADCTLVPLPVACIEQHEQTVRVSTSVQPFISSWEDTFGYADQSHQSLVGPKWTHSFIPVIGLFYDDVVDAKLNAAGVEPDGAVAGAKIAISMATSPAFTNYRLVLSASVQEILAFSRSSTRRGTFAKDSSLVVASANYELGARSFESGPRWIPSIGVSYTKGDDPIAGKVDQDYVALGFRLAYKPE